MRIPENGSQPGSSPVLPAALSNATQMVQQGAAATTSAAAANGGTATGPSLGRLDLAETERSRRCQRRADGLHLRAGFRMQDRVRHPDGGRCSVEEIVRHEKEARAHIEDETKRGSRKHHRLSRVIGWIPRLVLLLDFSLLLYFMAGITNVDWAAPMSAALAFAVVLAGMVTVLSYGFLTFTGHRMRAYKNHAGTVHLDELDGFTKAAFGLAISLIGVLALLMFIRMRAEVLDTLGPQAGVTVLVIPLSVAAVSAVANYLVITVHAFDGSDQVARLNKLSAATRRSVAKAQRMRERAARPPRVTAGSSEMPGRAVKRARRG